jgi:hypothetical protein
VAVSSHFSGLTDEQQRQAEARFADFDRSWTEKRLGAQLRDLPPPGDPLRQPLLLGLVRIDLRRRWQQGQRATVES